VAASTYFGNIGSALPLPRSHLSREGFAHVCSQNRQTRNGLCEQKGRFRIRGGAADKLDTPARAGARRGHGSNFWAVGPLALLSPRLLLAGCFSTALLRPLRQLARSVVGRLPSSRIRFDRGTKGATTAEIYWPVSLRCIRLADESGLAEWYSVSPTAAGCRRRGGYDVWRRGDDLRIAGLGSLDDYPREKPDFRSAPGSQP
jgi:hypothetical protein